MPALDPAEATRLLNSMFKLQAYTVPTTPLKLLLTTNTPGASTSGVEPTNSGGSAYAPQSLTAGVSGASVSTASGTATLSNNVAITFTNMPNATINGIEVRDNDGRRLCYASLAASKTTSTGDSLTFATSALSFALA